MMQDIPVRQQDIRFRQWALSRLCDGAYNRMSLTKRIEFWLESWCSYNYDREIVCNYHNRKLSPSGLEWETWKVPWYAKHIAGLEFQFRYLNMKQLPDSMTGRFPFYRRKSDIS